MSTASFDTAPPPGPRPPAVKPVDAATLIVLRRDGKKPRLLMGRRHRGHNFMPGLWVFPGGKIDRCDYHTPFAGELPDISSLEMIARAITPPHLPKRFDARFFLAPAEGLVSLDQQADCGELDEIAWVDIDEALALELPGITRFVVRDVHERLTDPSRPALFMRFVGMKSRTSTI